MKRVTGIGGVFIKVKDTQTMNDWYARHLGLEFENGYFRPFEWRERDAPESVGSTVWSLFAESSAYFEPSLAPFMVNFRVTDLDGLLEVLRAEGVQVLEKLEEYEYGRFAWIIDPEGNKIELWEPAEGH
jgi:predicted enzyme related to lactoylglutathione lyase